MNYRNYAGPRYTYQSLPSDLQAIAFGSFFRINIAHLTTNRPSTIDHRINTKFILKRRQSLSLIKRMFKDYDYMLSIFNANLVEFTAHGEYLNAYLE